MFGIESLRCMRIRRALPGLAPPHIAALPHGDGIAATLDHKHGVDRRRAFQGPVNVGLQFNDLAAPPPAVGRDDQLGLTIVDAVLDRLGTEAAEDDGVHGADPGAGEHGNYRLRNHGQVDGDAIARLDAHVFQNMGHAADVKIELAVGDRADITGLTFEN